MPKKPERPAEPVEVPAAEFEEAVKKLAGTEGDSVKQTKPRRETGKPVTLKGSRYHPSSEEFAADQTINASPREVMRSVVRLRKVRFEK
ncbi:MAG: hypothetical protein F4X77_15285 [Acidobacteriia bacterium]|nr:hypothetical protein [Terriglobia bacterium]